MSAVQPIEMYKCAEKVTAELEAMRYNNAVSQGAGRWHHLIAFGHMLLVACICYPTQQRHSFRIFHLCRLRRSVHVQISSMMSFVNVATKWDSFPLEGRRIFTLLLAPFAPHLAEELWQRQVSEQKTLVPTSALAMRSLVQVSTWSKPLMVLLHSHS